jgi:hypothetical protein
MLFTPHSTENCVPVGLSGETAHRVPDEGLHQADRGDSRGFTTIDCSFTRPHSARRAMPHINAVEDNGVVQCFTWVCFS